MREQKTRGFHRGVHLRKGLEILARNVLGNAVLNVRRLDHMYTKNTIVVLLYIFLRVFSHYLSLFDSLFLVRVSCGCTSDSAT